MPWTAATMTRFATGRNSAERPQPERTPRGRGVSGIVFCVHISTAYLHYCLVAMQCFILCLLIFVYYFNEYNLFIYKNKIWSSNLFSKHRSGLCLYSDQYGTAGAHMTLSISWCIM